MLVHLGLSPWTSSLCCCYLDNLIQSYACKSIYGLTTPKFGPSWAAPGTFLPSPLAVSPAPILFQPHQLLRCISFAPNLLSPPAFAMPFLQLFPQTSPRLTHLPTPVPSGLCPDATFLGSLPTTWLKSTIPAPYSLCPLLALFFSRAPLSVVLFCVFVYYLSPPIQQKFLSILVTAKSLFFVFVSHANLHLRFETILRALFLLNVEWDFTSSPNKAISFGLAIASATVSQLELQPTKFWGYKWSCIYQPGSSFVTQKCTWKLETVSIASDSSLAVCCFEWITGHPPSCVLLFIWDWRPPRRQVCTPSLLTVPHLLRISLAVLSGVFCWHFEILYLRSWGENKWRLKHGTIRRFYGWDKSGLYFYRFDNPAFKGTTVKHHRLENVLVEPINYSISYLTY